MGFIHKNEAFVCEHCLKPVPPRKTSCRNHCPFCLHSKHVDITPGDRANPCQGLLRPTAYKYKGKKGPTLYFECTKCKAQVSNIAAIDDPCGSDDFDQLLKLLSKVFYPG